MEPTALKTFVHPHSVYRLEYPSHWEQVIEKDGESCGFGPHDRNDVGLWISIMPMSVDTDQLAQELPKLMRQVMAKSGGDNLRGDTALKHYALIADQTKEDQAGHYWIVAGGDVILFASTQVPAAERDVWNPPFQKVMESLQITRDDELFVRKLANEVMARLQEKHPEQEFEFDENNRIRGQNRVVYLSNLCREVRASPSRREKLIEQFVTALGQPAMEDMGHEVWDECRGDIVPVLKPRAYLRGDGPTQHLHTTEWLADMVICYAIKSKKLFRFVTGWDLRRWGIEAQAFHDEAMANLARLPWPKLMPGSSARNEGRVILVETDDSLASSRVLHPKLYQLFSGPLGAPFWAGIPCRDTLVLFSDRKALKQRIGRRLKKDHDASAYAISPQPFLVTRDGIAAASTK